MAGAGPSGLAIKYTVTELKVNYKVKRCRRQRGFMGKKGTVYLISSSPSTRHPLTSYRGGVFLQPRETIARGYAQRRSRAGDPG